MSTTSGDDSHNRRHISAAFSPVCSCMRLVLSPATPCVRCNVQYFFRLRTGGRHFLDCWRFLMVFDSGDGFVIGVGSGASPGRRELLQDPVGPWGEVRTTVVKMAIKTFFIDARKDCEHVFCEGAIVIAAAHTQHGKNMRSVFFTYFCVGMIRRTQV